MALGMAIGQKPRPSRSSGRGLSFQTARSAKADLNLRRDPYLSALMTGEMIATHRKILAGKVARDSSFAELYMAHFLSVQGASRFMELLRDGPGPSEGVSARR